MRFQRPRQSLAQTPSKSSSRGRRHRPRLGPAVWPAMDLIAVRCNDRATVTAPTAFRADIPFVNDLGVEFLAADAGRATVALQLHARHLNSWNVAHGGVIMTLLDVAMAVAGRSLDPGAGGGVTVEMKTSFVRSEEHTSELQSPCNLVCRLLLEKKKQNSI